MYRKDYRLLDLKTAAYYKYLMLKELPIVYITKEVGNEYKKQSPRAVYINTDKH